ncbi:MAG: hypothetical protein JXA11_07085 [Phycisphaerae bacterium]|nr:hypothetical protein [Phycisphaerae bacterium]
MPAGTCGRKTWVFVIAVLTGSFLAVWSATADAPSTTQPSEAKDDLEYWLDRARPVAQTQPASKPAPLHADSPLRRDDALPGVIEFSNGLQMAGWMCTTREKPWRVWVAEEKRWRRIPPAAVLSITAIVDQEEMKRRWRWKAMGEPEKVYTGKSYPFRRFRRRFRLADGSEIIGVVKGQPIWIGTGNQTHGPFLLEERAKGEDGQSLRELIYIRKIVVSRRMMKAVSQQQHRDTKESADADSHD